MTKTQIWNEVQELMIAHKANKKLSQALEDLLKPKVHLLIHLKRMTVL